MNVILQLSREFNFLKSSIRAAYVAVGMITQKQFDSIMKDLAGCPTISIITGIHMPTPPDVLDSMMQHTISGRMASGVFTRNFFHPKLYLF